MGQSTDQIRREIDQSRMDAADKIDQLQTQVQDTAQDVRDNVQGTAEDVIDQVKDTVDETVESVKQNLDLRQHIEQRPLLSLGVALVGGFVLGGLTSGSNDHGGHGYQSGQPYRAEGGAYPGSAYSSHSSGSSASSGAVAQGLRTAVQKTGLEETISSAAAALIGSLTDQMKTSLDDHFPGFTSKMETAQESSGDFAKKTREAQAPSSS